MPDDSQQSISKSADTTQVPADDHSSTEGRFFSRWSSRKQNARDTSARETTDVEQSEDATERPADSTAQNLSTANDNESVTSADATGQALPAEQSPDEIVLTDADMPSLDTLSDSSDYSGFFSQGVSPELRKQALRHLFSHAVFNQRDGLNDYDEDYTTFEPLGDTITSDMRWHQARKERELAEQQAEEEKLRQAELASQEQESLADTTASETNQSEALESPDDDNENNNGERNTDQLAETTDAQHSDVQSQALADEGGSHPVSTDSSDNARKNTDDATTADSSIESDSKTEEKSV